MIKRVQLFLKQLVLLVDAGAILIAFFAAYSLRQDAPLGILKGLDSYLWLLLIILPLNLGILHFLGAYRELRVKSFFQVSKTLFKVHAIALLSFGSIVFLLKLHYVSRTFIVFFYGLSLLLVALERGILIECWHLMSSREYFRRRVLIAGTGPRARRFIQAVRAHRNWGLLLVGLVDPDPSLQAKTVDGFKILGTLEDLDELLKREVIDEVLFVLPRSRLTEIETAVLACERIGVRATVAADLFNLNFAKAQPTELDGIPVISFDSVPVDEWQLAIKRVLDLVIAGTGLFFLIPLFLAVAGLIRLTSPGPVFFRQIRCGVNGRRFNLYKFRSMVIGAEARLAELRHLNEMKGPVFKVKKDPRLTCIGYWLRKTSIDELPQLINVLKGEMSLVGPRPPLPDEVAQYEPWQRRRLSMRPGITGNWQIHGRNEIEDFDVWAELDLEYIDQWSLLLDARILLKTVPAVLSAAGAR
jgi:exopolysaccharide biosynthesis polyprenyl glycosylphosphotransferase